MYKVQRSTHKKYGNIVEILRAEIGEFDTPFFAVECAKKQRRLWKEEGGEKIRYLVDNQILNSEQLRNWSNEEYESLPKCGWCAKVLGEQVCTNTLSPGTLYCCQDCSDNDYHRQMDYLNDYEECDL
jgi:hypothetical protein